MSKRQEALSTARYLRTILSSVLGHDVLPVVGVAPDHLGLRALSEARQITLTLSVEDAHALAEALNRKPEGK